MADILLSPPLVFLISLALMWLFSCAASLLEHPQKEAAGKTEPYACGENVSSERVEPDYGGFFPFAIFFTLIHVGGLMLATWGLTGGMNVWPAALYAAGIAVILAVLFLD